MKSPLFKFKKANKKANDNSLPSINKNVLKVDMFVEQVKSDLLSRTLPSFIT